MKITSLFRTLAVSPLPIPTGLYAVPLRLIVGLGFAEHGYAKLARGPDAFGMILHNIGLPFADLLGWATVAVEIVAGLLVLVGAFVPVAALPMIVVLLVAIVTVHLPNGFSSVKLLSYDSTARTSVSRVMRPICSIWPDCWRSASAAPARSRSTDI